LNGKVLLKSQSTLTGIQSYNRTVRANHPWACSALHH
jgi:hypothetical protein